MARRHKARRRNPRLKLSYYKTPAQRAAKKRRRRASGRKGRSRRRRLPRGARRHKVTAYKARGRWYAPRRGRHSLRKGTRINGRRRRRHTMRNPLRGFLPSIGGVMDVLKVGAGVGIGYVATNAVLFAADKFFLASFKEGKSPTTVAAINAAVRALVGVPLAGMLGKSLLGPKYATSIYAGAAFNVVQHAVIDLNAAVKVIPDAYAGLLLDYDSAASGMFDYINSGTGVSDYLLDGGVNAGALPGGGNMLAADTPEQAGAFI